MRARGTQWRDSRPDKPARVNLRVWLVHLMQAQMKVMTNEFWPYQ
ncbi:hypothetical protein SBD_2124 [Streptomyces bottropensis ATCC 25435]|uniref:Uncharacterized protein n=1 Tax=Streptomyces bottropensis ATCC 25435 TaxID=1054862 RepID=M3F4Q2_9ACTN|nr:hypothetical protein SBD_2124 [Streptomyces bottropensis ATCC 25435]